MIDVNDKVRDAPVPVPHCEIPATVSVPVVAVPLMVAVIDGLSDVLGIVMPVPL